MPTPFVHLEIGERIRASKRLSATVQGLVERSFPAFYLGSVAPDFQTICDIPRAQTHFYGVPPDDSELGYPRMLTEYPQLARGWLLPQAQAVFVAAYCAHLILDLRWYREVLVPMFLNGVDWQSHSQRFLVHNTLLTYLDRRAAASLPATVAAALAAARPAGWLPFAKDSDLVRWRDFLVDQLKPGSKALTVEIFAERLSMSPETFEANIQDEAWMEHNLFSRVPVDSVTELLASAVDDSVVLIEQYLGARDHRSGRRPTATWHETSRKLN